MATSTSSAPTRPSPLWIISLFVSLTEVIFGFVAYNTSGAIQIALLVFAAGFGTLVAVAFFYVLWHRPVVFYSPDYFGKMNVTEYVKAYNSLSSQPVTKTSDLNETVHTFGDPDHFRLLFKASADMWSRSTKAMDVPGGCLVQVSTKMLSANGVWALAEALSFVPHVVILDEPDGNGRRL